MLNVIIRLVTNDDDALNFTLLSFDDYDEVPAREIVQERVDREYSAFLEKPDTKIKLIGMVVPFKD